MSTDELELFRKVFNKLDIDQDGMISRQDLETAFTKANIINTQDNARTFLEKANHHTQHDAFTFDEFVCFMQEAREHLQGLFNDIDQNNDGLVDASELFQSCRQHIPDVDLEGIQEIIRSIDRDGSNTLSLSEFCDYYLVERIEFYMPSFLASKKEFLRTIWRDQPLIDVGEATVPSIAVDQEVSSFNWLRVLLSGGVAGSVSRTCTAPLDRIKVIMQAKASSQYRIGLFTGFRHMVEEGGFFSMWRGNGTNVIKIAPETALKFFCFEAVKRHLKGDKPELSNLDRVVAGSCAGAFSQTVIYPLEVLKTRLVLSKTGQYTGMMDCFVKIFKREGVRSFYRGYAPNLIGIIPYAGIDLAAYETLKAAFIRSGNIEPNAVTYLTCGALSSTCGVIVAYPLALVRTRMQAHGSGSPKSEGSMKHIVKRIWLDNGLRGFYRGIVPNFIKVLPAVSISYAVYEKVKLFLGATSA